MKKLLTLMAIVLSLAANSQCLQKCVNASANFQWNQTDAAGNIIANDPTNTYDWTLTLPFTGDGTATINVADVGATAGNYTITLSVTNGLGCTEDFTYCMDVISTTCTLDPVIVCENATIDLTPLGNPAGGTFSGAGVSGTTFDPSVGSGPITYSITANGCGGSDTENPTINPAPSGAISGN